MKCYSLQLRLFRPLVALALLLFFAVTFAVAQQRGNTLAYQQAEKKFDISEVCQELEQPEALNKIQVPWWHEHVTGQQRKDVSSLDVTLDSIIFLAVRSSKKIQIASLEPIIRETLIEEEDSKFDWVKYLSSAWNDSSDPVGNSLTVGGSASQLNEHNIQGNAGVRRLTRSGGQLDIGQRYGFQNSNSTFLTPNNQATSRFTISYTHPLRRGNGNLYNNSLIMLAVADSEIAYDQFTAELQDHLLEIVRSYWWLYLERAVLSQRVGLYLKTKELVSILKTRQLIDTKGTQLISASAALENRRADLIRALTSVKNAETQMRALTNAANLGIADMVELIPIESPVSYMIETDLASEVEKAFQMRPEARASLREVKSGAIRQDIAQHEILPVLNLVTEGYLSGLRGNSDFGGAFVDQFAAGAPSYSVGVQYEVPFGNRRAFANMTRRQVELRRLKLQYEQTLETIRTEVDIAVREMRTSYQEIYAKQRALAAAESDAQTIQIRWSRMIDGNGQSGLNLESLLRAQERVSEAEKEMAESLLMYNLALVNLKKANGTFLRNEQITIDRVDDSDGPRYVLGKSVHNAICLEELEVKPGIDPLQTLATQEFPPLLIPAGGVQPLAAQGFQSNPSRMPIRQATLIESEQERVTQPSFVLNPVNTDATLKPIVDNPIKNSLPAPDASSSEKIITTPQPVYSRMLQPLPSSSPEKTMWGSPLTPNTTSISAQKKQDSSILQSPKTALLKPAVPRVERGNSEQSIKRARNQFKMPTRRLRR